MASNIIKFSSHHSNGRSILHSLCHGQRRVLGNSIHGCAKSILPLEQFIRLESRSFFSCFTTNSNNNSGSVVAPQLPSSSPCMMLHPLVNKATREKVFRFFSLADRKVWKIKQHKDSLLPIHAEWLDSCHNWLAFIDPRDCSLYLWNPFSPSQDVIQLPSLQTLPYVLGVFHGSHNGSVKKFILKDESSYRYHCNMDNRSVRGFLVQVFHQSSYRYHCDMDNRSFKKFILEDESSYRYHCDMDNRSVKKFILKDESSYRYHCDMKPKYLSKYIIKELAFSSAPSPSLDNNDCIVMAIEGVDSGLVYCKPGGDKWIVLDAPLRPYDHIWYSKKMQQFYAMSEDGDIEAWDLRDLSSIKRTSIVNYNASWLSDYEMELRIQHWNTEDYMVESLSGDLLLVRKYLVKYDHKSGAIFRGCHYSIDRKLPFKTLRIDVYKLNPLTGKWDNMKCIGEQALFVGFNQPFSLRAADFPGLRPNSIYFTCFGGENEGVYNMRSNRVEQFLPFGRLMRKHNDTAPVWVAPPHAV